MGGAHNDYLQFLNELGLVGVVFPGVVVAIALGRAYRTLRSSSRETEIAAANAAPVR